jgi:parvulin-like peptidyl-prolyl isomerase
LILSRRLLALPLLAALLAVAACGGGSNGSTDTTPAITVPLDSVAVVDGTSIPKSQYDQLFSQYQAAYKAQKRDFPKPGTPEYEGLKQQTLNALVQRVELAKEAAARGITVADADVQTELTKLKQQYYGGDEQKYLADLKTFGATEQSVEDTIRAGLIAQKLFDQVTKGVTVTEQQITDYYNANKSQFTTAEQRHVAHILVKTRKEADDIYQQLQGGADFATLARKYSTDAGSAKNGGDLGTAPREQWVKPFGDAAVGAEDRRDQHSGEVQVRLAHHQGGRRYRACEDPAAQRAA